MVRILFICHGNICRSPMAEFLMKDYVEKMGRAKDFYIASAATSTEEIGNPVHYGTARILDSYNIDYSKKRARQMTREDYDNYDYLIYMDSYNLSNMRSFVGSDKDHKCHLLLSYAKLNRDISDPWYTHNFNKTRDDIILGIEGLYASLLKNKVI